jgi:hypothetical protein
MQKILQNVFKLGLLLLIIFSVCLQNLNIEIEMVKADSSSEWLKDWQYRKSHVINPSVGAGANYQIRIKAYYGNGVDGGENVYFNGKCRSDFGDIRFTSFIPSVEYYRIMISPNVHDSYGLGYPVTYIFNIPAGSSNLKVYKRTGTDWQQLIEKTSNDFFNGIECVRFDYIDNKAYVSVAFAEGSDCIDIKITNQNGEIIQAEYQGISHYYDNRKAVVVATADDWEDNSIRNQKFMQACDVFQSKQVWLTVSIVTQSYEGGSPPNWSGIQRQINEGYIEAASHSRTHPYVPYSNYDSEIGGSKNDITGNLSLPSPYKKGTNEYVWAWIEPYGHLDSIVRQKLGQYKYLIDRETSQGVTSFATWDSVNGLYNRVGVTKEVFSSTTLSELNSAFDNTYAISGIYHFYFHPYDFDWSGENVITQHLDYIKNKTDIWYVGFGALYAYHYVQERGQVTVTPIYSGDGEQRLLDYWMEEKVDGNYAVFWVKVSSDLSINPVTIYIYYGKSDATTTSNGENTFLFFDDFLGTSYDPNKWQTVGSPTITVSNGELKIKRDSYSGSWSVHGLRSKTFQADEKRLIVKAKTNVFSDSCNVRVDMDYYSRGWTNKAMFEGSLKGIYHECDQRDTGGGYAYITMASGAATNSYYTLYLARWGSSYSNGWVNGAYKGQVTLCVNDGLTYIGLFIEEWGSHGTIIGAYDWMAVAKYVDPEPSHGSWGSEETFSEYVVVDQSFVTDGRADVGSIQTVGFHAKWVKNDSNVVQGSIYVNGIEYITNGTGWISFTVTSSLVGKQEWTVTSVNCGGVTTYIQTIPNPTIIWDQIKITNGGITKESAMLGETITIWFQARYEYDNKAFDDTNGVLYVNGAKMTWSSTNNRWEYQYTLATPGIKTFTVSGVLDSSYGLSTINDTTGSQNIDVWSLPFSIISNSTITELTFNSTTKTIRFNVSGPEGTVGYTNITMAKTLVINITGLSIHLDEKSIEYTFEETWYAWIVHLIYSHSTHKVTIFLSAPPPVNTIATSTSSSETLVILLIGLLVCKCLGKKLRKPQLT